jgi:hypothetical protein
MVNSKRNKRKKTNGQKRPKKQKAKIVLYFAFNFLWIFMDFYGFL